MCPVVDGRASGNHGRAGQERPFPVTPQRLRRRSVICPLGGQMRMTRGRSVVTVTIESTGRPIPDRAGYLRCEGASAGRVEPQTCTLNPRLIALAACPPRIPQFSGALSLSVMLTWSRGIPSTPSLSTISE